VYSVHCHHRLSTYAAWSLRDLVREFSPGRFSKNDATHSLTSAEDSARKNLRGLSTLCASIGWSAPAIFQSIWRISATDTCRRCGLAHLARASARAAGIS